MDGLPPELIRLDFDEDAYRTAIALLTAYTYGDEETCEALLAGADRDLACAFTIILWAAIGMVAERGDFTFAEELQALGRTAARFAAGEPS